MVVRHEVTRDWCDGCARCEKFKCGAVGGTVPRERERVFEETSIALLRVSFITK